MSQGSSSSCELPSQTLFKQVHAVQVTTAAGDTSHLHLRPLVLLSVEWGALSSVIAIKNKIKIVQDSLDHLIQEHQSNSIHSFPNKLDYRPEEVARRSRERKMKGSGDEKKRD